MTTELKTKTKTKTEKATDDAKSIASLLVEASTPQQKGVATRKLNAYLAKREAEGKNRKHVHACIKSWVTRIQKVND